MYGTDVGAVGLGVVLEQEDNVVAYVNRSLTTASVQCYTKRMFSSGVCTQTVSSLLLEHPVCLLTDHAPLQWLSVSALQEYEFQIVYRQGSLNSNPDTLYCLDTTPFPKLLHVILQF